MSNREKSIFCIKWYLTTLFIFNSFNFLLFLVIESNKEWELFSFNFFGSVAIYTLSFLLYKALTLLFDFVTKNFVYQFITLCVLIELLSLFFNESIIVSIVSDMTSNGNYILLFYPISLFVSLIIVNLAIKCNKSIRF